MMVPIVFGFIFGLALVGVGVVVVQEHRPCTTLFEVRDGEVRCASAAARLEVYKDQEVRCVCR